MKRALLLLALVAPVSARAQVMQDWSSQYPIEFQVHYRINEIKGLVLFGYTSGLTGGPRGPLKDYAKAAVQLLALTEKVIAANSDKPDWPNSPDAWSDYFWMFKWLGHTLSNEIVTNGDSLDEYFASVERIKVALKHIGIVVKDPYVRFSDVPVGHWADEAIHNLRRAGIVTGFPDNTFRGG